MTSHSCVQVLEEIPREHHCAIINELTAMAGRWVAVTMGSLVTVLPGHVSIGVSRSGSQDLLCS